MQTQTNHFPILIEQDEDSIYIVSCPTFKACHSYGKTIDEALKNIQEVIELCLEEKNEMPINKFIGFRDLHISHSRAI